jgi:hypothetical protein
MEICGQQEPSFEEIANGHRTACWLYQAHEAAARAKEAANG